MLDDSDQTRILLEQVETGNLQAFDPLLTPGARNYWKSHHVKELSDDFGIAWLGLGIDPFHEVSEIPTMPKRRYDIMRAYLPTRGSHGLEMMHATATVQANFDYSDEADMIEKMRVALVATPIVSAW